MKSSSVLCCCVMLLSGGGLALQAPPPQQIAKMKSVAKALASATLTAGLLLSPLAGNAFGNEKRSVASMSASGFFFKDKLTIDAFKDPQVDGVTIYLSDFERPITERLSKNFFSDPSQSGLGCVRRQTPLAIKGKLSTSPEGEEVINESRSLMFKAINVRRVYDQQSNSLVYVAYSTRLNTNDDSNKARFASSLCVLPLDPPAAGQDEN